MLFIKSIYYFVNKKNDNYPEFLIMSRAGLINGLATNTFLRLLMFLS